jgi:hypothetical protein
MLTRHRHFLICWNTQQLNAGEGTVEIRTTGDEKKRWIAVFRADGRKLPACVVFESEMTARRNYLRELQYGSMKVAG